MTPHEIQSILQKKFPTASIQYVGEGWTSTAFCVDDKIVRVPKTDVEKYKKEAKVLNFLQGKLTIPIPRPQVVEGDMPYAIHTKIEGLKWDIDTYEALPAQQQNDFCCDIATFFHELHNIPCSDVATVISLEELKMHALVDHSVMYSYLKDVLSIAEVDKLYNFTLETNKPQTDLVLLHKDFHDNNSLIDEQHRLSGVFDFANVGLGERVNDFRPLYYHRYIPLLEKVLKFYTEMSGATIELERIRDLQKADCLFCLQYLGKNPHLKETMPDEWNKQVAYAQNILKEL